VFAGSFTSPTGTTASPYVVPGDSSGNPQPFTITGSGYPVGAQVYVEQCSGIDPASAGWDPTIECDSFTSPAAAIADASGNVTFSKTDPNRAFHPFKGSSPSGTQFNCLSPNDPDPKNGLPSYRNCKVRMSTSNAAVTSDQAFLPIQLPDTKTPPPVAPEAPYAVLLPLGAVGLAGGFVLLRKRRPSAASA
jgi:hypothetical protein